MALGLGNTIATNLRLRTCRFATVEAATRLARFRSDLAAAAGPSLGSAKEPALTPAWRRLVGYHRHVPVLAVRPHVPRLELRFSGEATPKLHEVRSERIARWPFGRHVPTVYRFLPEHCWRE